MKGFMSGLVVAASLFSGTVFADDPVHVGNYEDAVDTKGRNVLVVFGTDWCGGCRKLKGERDSLNLDDYVVCMVDADKHDEIAEKYSVSAYPTSVILYEGREISRKKGYSKPDYQKWLDSNRRKPEANKGKDVERPEDKKPSCGCSCGCGRSEGGCECGIFCSCWWMSFFGKGCCR